MTDQRIDQLWAALRDDPADDAGKLALADLYAEAGDPDFAYAIRWCVARRKWPASTPKGRRHKWYRGADRSAPGGAALPNVLFDARRPRVDHYPDCRTAVVVLAVAIHNLRQAVTIPGEPPCPV